uniref:SWIM-type domain-containing protein n=1 Tax=Globisporangium ultimum (strain ATCC 200006 / CBS 805.95 / DAOM BR144) TaxID=431595 RepID=K3WWF6_GLOUD
MYAVDHLVRYMLHEKLILETDEVAFVKQAHATESVDEFRAILNNLRLYRPSATSFLESLDPRTWAFCANLDRPWHGRQLDLSSAVDSSTDGSAPTPDSIKVNSIETPCQYLYERMNAMMKNLFERSASAKKWTETTQGITPYAKQLLDQESNLVDQYEVLPCSTEIVYVRHASNQNEIATHRRTRKVHLREKTCTCTTFHQFRIPCRHILAALTFAGNRADGSLAHAFFDPCYLVSSYATAFRDKFIQIPLEEDLEANSTILPPQRVLLPASGRSSNKRKQPSVNESQTSFTAAEGTSVRTYQCSVCKSQDGHNRKTCPQMPR